MIERIVDMEQKEKEKKEQKKEQGTKADKKKISNTKLFKLTKNIVLTLCVLGCILFVAANKEYLYDSAEFSAKNGRDRQEYSMLGNKTVEQKFVVSKGNITEMMIRFHNQGFNQAKGKVIITILDSEGKELGSAKKILSNINARKAIFKFDEPVPTEDGQIYTLRIETKKARNKQGFSLMLSKKKQWLWQEMTGAEGVDEEWHVMGKYTTQFFAVKNLCMMAATLIFALLMIWLPWDKLNAWIQKKRAKGGKEVKPIDVEKLMARILFFTSPLVAFIIVEMVGGFGFVTFFQKFFSWRGLLNSFLFGVIWWVLYTITNRMKYTCALMVSIPLVLALANYFVWSFRGSPIIATDIASIATAANVADSYEYALNMDTVMAIVFTAAFIISALALKSYKGLKWKPRLAFAGGMVVVILSCYTLFFQTDFLKSKNLRIRLWNPVMDWSYNGSALSFMMTWTYARVEKPDGYSLDAVKALTEKYPSDKVTEQEDLPNVICIMNEAFSDLEINGEIPMSGDPMPYIRGLTEDTVKGMVHVSVRGGNTANSEFEFLTGNTMAFFTYRSVAYTTYVKEVIPSLTYSLKAQGYAYNKAMHPYMASGWKRPEVYPLLGFEGFLSETDFENPEYVRNFISDKTDFDKIISEYEATRKDTDKPFYTFNVTMQNHGGYKGNRGFVEPEITVTDESMESKAEADQYLTLIKYTDDAFKDLLDYFKNVDEKTIIVMFGDHQPSISDSFYRAIYGGKKLSTLSTQQNEQMYQTPFILWANYDIEEEQDMDISANYLSSYMLNIMGANLTGYNKFLLDMYEKVPVITGEAYIGDDGKVRTLRQKSEYTDAINDYNILQYNGMFDTENRDNEFFFLNPSDGEK